MREGALAGLGEPGEVRLAAVRGPASVVWGPEAAGARLELAAAPALGYGEWAAWVDLQVSYVDLMPCLPRGQGPGKYLVV